MNIDYNKRRKSFIGQLLENSLVIIPNNSLSIYSNDVEYKFKPYSDFYYLTGFDEPNSVCLLKKESKTSFTYILFVEPRDKEKEIWTGKRTGIQGAKSVYKANLAFLISEFDEKIKKLILDIEHIYLPLGKNKDLDLKITNLINELSKSNRTSTKFPKTISDPREFIHKMRLIKDNNEIDCIQKAADISRKAHTLAMAYSKSGIYEYELEAIIEYKFRASGGIGPAYPTIVGSGKNSTILHYTKNNKLINKSDLILIDAGCEYNYYASDLTRTFPANKKFNPIQRDIYEIVLESQIKAIDQIKPNKRFNESYNKAIEVLVDGLKELKLLKGSKEKIIKKGEYKKFFMHRLGHWLGLDVHDVGPYFDSKEKSIRLKPGMVMTVEPGIYISNDLENVPDKFKGIGIRIEDDILVTKSGNKILTNGAPKTISEIESLG